MYFKLKIISAFLKLRLNKWLYKGRLAKLQARRWKKVNRQLRSSPFYQDLVRKNSEFSHFPVINKSIFMENFDQINTRNIKRDEAFDIATQAESSRDFAPMIDGITIGLSSGTSGNRGVFLASENERAQWVACILDRVIGFSIWKRSVAFFLRSNSNLYDSVRSKILNFEFFDLMENLEDQVSRLETLNPTILVAQPSLLMELARKIESRELSICPEKIISVAEVLYPEDASYLEAVFKQTIHQVYQCTEGLLASTCEHGTLHFNEDFLIIEKKYVDKEKRRFHPIITDLLRVSQPVIRYELNDIIHEKANCPCGLETTAIEHIEGRSDDVLMFGNEIESAIKIFPDFFRRAIIMSDAEIQDYTLVQSDKKELTLYVNGQDSQYISAKQAIIDLLNKKNVHDIIIQRATHRSHQRGNKLRRVRNDYWKTN